ncbi:MAG: hypothetical protein V2A34_15045, partial [Lentisphaerota bacterium]
DEEVSRLIRECHARAIDIIKAHRDKLDIMAKLLIERETLDGRDVKDIILHGRLLSEVERGEQDKEKADAAPGGVAAEAPKAAEASPALSAPAVPPAKSTLASPA